MYVDEAFEAVKLLLEERGSLLPEQAANTPEKKHLKLAYDYYEEGEHFDKALEECDSAIDLDPSLADAHNLRGILLRELGQPIEALNAYKKALKIEPGFHEAEENLARLKSELTASKKFVTIAKFSFPSEAYIPRMELEAKGIQVFLADEETLTAAPHLSIAVGGVRLQVNAHDVKRALEVLNREPEQAKGEDVDNYPWGN